MLILFLRFLKGFIRIKVSGAYPERFINLCQINGIILWNIIRIDDSIYVNIDAKKFKKIRKIRKKSNVKIRIHKKSGFYFLIKPYIRRKGLAIGLILFFLINTFLSGFIWNIEIKGNKSIADEKILQNCKNIGIYEGTLSKNIDTADARLKLIMQNGDISWASFIIEGSHLTVNILETDKVEKNDKSPGNIIALRDGIVEYIEISKGKPLVKMEEPVVKGQILATGVIEYSDGTTHFTKATGKVYAKTECELETTVKLNRTKKIKTNNTKKMNVLEFFSFKIPLNFSVVNYPHIKNVNKNKFEINNAYLPIYLYDINIVEIKKIKSTISKKEARLIGYKNLDKQEQDEFSDAEIIDYEEEIICNKNELKIIRKYNLRENIAKFQKIEINTVN